MLTIRDARPGDLGALVEIMWTDPSEEAVALVGDAARARRFSRHLFEHALAAPSAGAIRLVLDEEEPVGFIQTTATGSDTPPARVLIASALRAFGWTLPGVLLRSRARARVDLKAPDGATHIVELQVHPSRRGSGIGGHLLADAESRAADSGVELLSLTTTITNPARRLYDRRGFVVVDEVTDARYQQITGVPGRVLMVKRVGEQPNE